MKMPERFVDPAFAPILQRVSKLAGVAAVAGWVYLLVAFSMTKIGPIAGPAGRQLQDTVAESGWLMFGLLSVLSALAWLCHRLGLPPNKDEWHAERKVDVRQREFGIGLNRWVLESANYWTCTGLIGLHPEGHKFLCHLDLPRSAKSFPELVEKIRSNGLDPADFELSMFAAMHPCVFAAGSLAVALAVSPVGIGEAVFVGLFVFGCLTVPRWMTKQAIYKAIAQSKAFGENTPKFTGYVWSIWRHVVITGDNKIQFNNSILPKEIKRWNVKKGSGPHMSEADGSARPEGSHK